MTVMKRALAVVLLAGTSYPAMAGVVAPPAVSTNQSMVEPVDSWRYHRDCRWGGGRWVVDLGAGKLIACRPYRPHGDWRWHREGDREGWYDGRRHAWHNDRW